MPFLFCCLVHVPPHLFRRLSHSPPGEAAAALVDGCRAAGFGHHCQRTTRGQQRANRGPHRQQPPGLRRSAEAAAGPGPRAAARRAGQYAGRARAPAGGQLCRLRRTHHHPGRRPVYHARSPTGSPPPGTRPGARQRPARLRPRRNHPAAGAKPAGVSAFGGRGPAPAARLPADAGCDAALPGLCARPQNAGHLPIRHWLVARGLPLVAKPVGTERQRRRRPEKSVLGYHPTARLPG